MSILAKHLFKPHLEPGEGIIAVCHRHFFTILGDIVRLGLLGFFVPTFLWYMFPEFALFFFLWMIVSFGRLFYILFDWYHDALLITNVSLILVGWNGFFDRSSARLEYRQIDGISYAIRGFRRTVFNYGDVTVNGGGAGAVLTLKDAVNPSKVERLILGYQEKFVSEENLKDSDSLKDLLTVMLRHHAKTKGVPKAPAEENS